MTLIRDRRGEREERQRETKEREIDRRQRHGETGGDRDREKSGGRDREIVGLTPSRVTSSLLPWNLTQALASDAQEGVILICVSPVQPPPLICSWHLPLCP